MNDEINAGMSCEYCGLPIPGRRLAKISTTTAEPLYCCAGCRFAAGILEAESTNGHAQRLLLRLGFATFCAMNVLVFSMALWGRDVYGTHASDATALARAIDATFRYATLLFAMPVLVLLGGPLFANAHQAARRAVITADMLVLIGVVSAFAYSTISVVMGEGRIYFEVGCVVLAFLTLGKWFEASGKLKMSQSLDQLAKLLPSTVHLVSDGAVRDVPIGSIRIGDTIRVLAGERIPLDGRIRSGTAEIDAQIVTGESRSITKLPGDMVFSGTLNIDGDLRVFVTSASGNETVSRMLEMVRKARRAPGHFQRLVDRIAKWFVPIVAILALAAAIHRGRASGIDAGILSGLAVALIACPCAFALATPMAIWTAMGRAARAHIFFRGGPALEQLAKMDTLFIDKTGTLTSGEADVTAIVVAESTRRDEVFARAAALASGSNHPLSTAIRKIAETDENGRAVFAVTTIPGKGLSACIGGEDTYLGSRRLMNEVGLEIPTSLEQAGVEFQGNCSLAYLGWSDRVRAAFAFQEKLRPQAPNALATFRNLGLQTTVLTGDTAARAAWLETRLTTRIIAEQLPADKAAAVEDARRQGRVVGMVGDGINDAPALATADVGIAMGCGADLSRDSAAICLLSNDLAQLPWLIALARQTTRVIRQNLFWAFIYNIAGIGLAMSGQLNPVWAGAAMVASSSFVVTNSLRLNSFPALSDRMFDDQPHEILSRESVEITVLPQSSVERQINSESECGVAT